MCRDSLTDLAAIPFNDAEDFGYLKVDFLHLNVYKNFKTREEIDLLLEIEPDWNLLLLSHTHPKLFQLAKHGPLLLDIRPRNILDLADAMALIRPAKKHILPVYKKDKKAGRTLLWLKEEDSGYAFKKSHAISYAYVVWLQLHLIEQGKL